MQNRLKRCLQKLNFFETKLNQTVITFKKNMRFFFLFIIFLTIGTSIKCIGQEIIRPLDPKSLGQNVFSSLQKNDLNQFLSLIFTESDCEIMANNADAPDSLKIEAVKQMKSLINKTRRDAKENFDNTINQVKQKGIKWSKVELLEIQFEVKNRQNIESSDIFLWCKFKKIEFIIKLDNCHKSDTWLMMDQVELIFKE